MIHGYRGEWIDNNSCKQVSVGIFELRQNKKGNWVKAGPVKYRVYGSSKDVDKIKARAQEIIARLDSGWISDKKSEMVK